MTGYRINFPNLNDHATALGYVIITWGYLQMSLAEFLKALIPVQDNITKNILTFNFEERDIIKIIIELSWYRFGVNRNNEGQYDELVTLLKNIDQKLRPKRNRFIHDLWIDDQTNNAVLYDNRTKMARREQNGPKIPMQGDQENIDKEDIWSFIQEIQDASFQLTQFHIKLINQQ